MLLRGRAAQWKEELERAGGASTSKEYLRYYVGTGTRDPSLVSRPSILLRKVTLVNVPRRPPVHARSSPCPRQGEPVKCGSVDQLSTWKTAKIGPALGSILGNFASEVGCRQKS